jgi:hypothetical protein
VPDAKISASAFTELTGKRLHISIGFVGAAAGHADACRPQPTYSKPAGAGCHLPVPPLVLPPAWPHQGLLTLFMQDAPRLKKALRKAKKQEGSSQTGCLQGRAASSSSSQPHLEKIAK